MFHGMFHRPHRCRGYLLGTRMLSVLYSGMAYANSLIPCCVRKKALAPRGRSLASPVLSDTLSDTFCISKEIFELKMP